jgi:hypothetical protein
MCVIIYVLKYVYQYMKLSFIYFIQKQKKNNFKDKNKNMVQNFNQWQNRNSNNFDSNEKPSWNNGMDQLKESRLKKQVTSSQELLKKPPPKPSTTLNNFKPKLNSLIKNENSSTNVFTSSISKKLATNPAPIWNEAKKHKIKSDSTTNIVANGLKSVTKRATHNSQIERAKSSEPIAYSLKSNQNGKNFIKFLKSNSRLIF